ncbi:4-carboxymuconolactone decarboxylase [Mumia zhuanghuii]|uniref:4-carboxymuconolactone decarboxylase n=2 Tax=Mumia TaxID=1546255 RepID=A0ABW1QQA5_9ACTN|nr:MULTISPECIES: 4-carboxymuconolactone decarboxylase [Mumia]KAA1424949.1 4-carboxymuconolactone decarboxylase [Mumia zhuanghuii]
MTVPRITGVELAGHAGLPLLVVGPSLGTSAVALWSAAAKELGADFHVIGWDLPGHVDGPVRGGFTIAELAEGVLAFASGAAEAREDEALRFAYAGDSVGGAVGLQLMLDAPDAVTAAVLLCTGAQIGDTEMWRERAATVRASGTPVMVTGSAQRWFAPGFLEREPSIGAALLHVLQGADAEGYAQVCDALAVFDVRDRLGEIAVPVLAVAGAHDVATPVAKLEEIANGVRNGDLLVLPDVAHLAPAEAPADVSSAIRAVWGRSRGEEPHPTAQIGDGDGAVGADGDGAYTRGMEVRRAVLGDAHVDRATASADPLTRPFQELITRYAWGDVWGRDGLDRRSRSMITLALLAALGHEKELAMHVRAALRNGLTREEIAEVLLHTGVYAGVPVTNAALGVMQGVFAELDQDS